MYYKSISSLECICVTAGISLLSRLRNISHRDASGDVNINLFCRDVSRDDCRIPLLRDTSRDGCRKSLRRDVYRDNSRSIIVEMPS